MNSINAAKKKIVNGTSVMFFPEGSRSLDGQLGVFKKGAFKTAFDLDLPVLPVTVNGTWNVCPAQSWDILPGKVRITIHPPISLEGYSYDNVSELVDDVRKVIESGLEPIKPRKKDQKGKNMLL
jgi:1-acyl-sn-glycerol-3-phosphate acyltransferase